MGKDKNDIEDLFKDSFDNFETEVKPKVWSNVKTALKWGGAGLFIKFLFNKIGTNTLVAIISSVVTIIGTLWTMDWEKSKSGNTAQNNTVETSPKTALMVDSSNHYQQNKTTTTNTSKANASVAAQPETKVETKQDETKVEKSFKNTSLREIKEPDSKKIRSVITDFSKNPIAIISANPVSGAAPLVVNLQNIGLGTENKWTFSDGQKTSTDANPACVFINPGTHSIILQSKTSDGKMAADTVRITVVANSSMTTPTNVFSPNDDGSADVFTFQSKNMSKISAEIYDKKGHLVYKWSGIDGKWDGRKLNGEMAPEGIYYYIVNAEGVDGKKYAQNGIIKLTR